MAASMFRGSCALYWLTWLVSLSYVLGISIFEVKYIIPSEGYANSVSYVKASCYLILSFSIVGCVFVKCDVSHIICFLLYVIPVLIIIPTICVVSIVKVRATMEDSKSEQYINKTLDILIRKVDAFRTKTKKYPKWLERNEFDNKCCGIRDWRDYITDFEKGTPNASNSTDDSFPIPKTCCCRSKNLSEYDYLTFQKSPNPSISPANIIHRKGCGKIMIEEFESLKNTHVIFMFVLIIGCIVMLIVYVKNWCSTRPWNGGSSQHSLDIERVSLIDIKEDDDPARPSIDVAAVRRSVGTVRAAPGVSGTKPTSKAPTLPPPPPGKMAPTVPGMPPGGASKYKYASISK